MTKLECHVSNCASNCDDCCCRPDIQVDGARANSSEQTCCSSFQDKDRAFTNAIRHDVPNSALDVGCSACNCAFNEEGRCHADSVCVQGCGAEISGQTECSTFRCK